MQDASIVCLHAWLVDSVLECAGMILIQHTVYVHSVVELIECCGKLWIGCNVLANKLADDAS